MLLLLLLCVCVCVCVRPAAVVLCCTQGLCAWYRPWLASEEPAPALQGPASALHPTTGGVTLVPQGGWGATMGVCGTSKRVGRERRVTQRGGPGGLPVCRAWCTPPAASLCQSRPAGCACMMFFVCRAPGRIRARMPVRALSACGNVPACLCAMECERAHACVLQRARALRAGMCLSASAHTPYVQARLPLRRPLSCLPPSPRLPTLWPRLDMPE